MKQFKDSSVPPTPTPKKRKTSGPTEGGQPTFVKEQNIRRAESLAALVCYLIDHLCELSADHILMHLRKLVLAIPEDKRVKATILTAIGRMEATMFHQGCILAYQAILLLEPVMTNMKLCQQAGLKMLQKFQSDFEESIDKLDYKVSAHLVLIMLELLFSVYSRIMFNL